MRTPDPGPAFVVLTASASIRRIWLRELTGSPNLSGEKFIADCIPFTYPIPGSRQFALIGPLMGAPAAVFAVEQVMKGKVGSLLMVGLAGGIATAERPVKIGDLVFPRGSFSEEGTSRLLGAETGPTASPSELQLSLEQEIEGGEGESKGRRGKIWTTDVPTMESPEKVADFAKKGVLAVDMEYSALLALSLKSSLSLASCFVISDLPGSGERGFTSPEVAVRLQTAIAGAARLIRRLLP